MSNKDDKFTEELRSSVAYARANEGAIQHKYGNEYILILPEGVAEHDRKRSRLDMIAVQKYTERGFLICGAKDISLLDSEDEL